jgi:hypothetical protein
MQDPRPWLAAVLRDESPPWPGGTDPEDSDHVLTVAQVEGVQGLLLAGLSRYADPSRFPPSLLPALQRLNRRESAAELGREIELERVLGLLADADLTPLLMKGTALAYTLYPAPHLRSRCDTDLLFPDRAAAERAWPVLQAIGYQRPYTLSGQFISHEFGCYRIDALPVSHTLDIHWKMSNFSFFAEVQTYAELAAAAQPVPSLGPQARALGEVHALLLACLHRLGHASTGQGNRLIWLYDIHLLAGHLTTSQWAFFVDIATRRGLSSLCLDGLLTAQCRLATELPTAVVTALSAAAASDWLTPRLLTSKVGRWFAVFRSLPNVRSRLIWLREVLFPDPHYMLMHYQTRLPRCLPLRYLLRIVTGTLKLFRRFESRNG